MRKLVLLLFFLYSSCLFSCGYDKYIGFDMGHTAVNYMDTTPSSNQTRALMILSENKVPIDTISEKKSKIGHTSHFGNVYFGQRINDYVSMEVGFFSHIALVKSPEGRTASYGAHVSFFLPLQIYKRSEILLGFGLAHTFTHANKPEVFEFKEHNIVPRVTIAHQYQVNDRLKIRISAIFVPINDWHAAIVTTSVPHYIGIGLNYSFDVI